MNDSIVKINETFNRITVKCTLKDKSCFSVNFSRSGISTAAKGAYFLQNKENHTKFLNVVNSFISTQTGVSYGERAKNLAEILKQLRFNM